MPINPPEDVRTLRITPANWPTVPFPTILGSSILQLTCGEDSPSRPLRHTNLLSEATPFPLRFQLGTSSARLVPDRSDNPFSFSIAYLPFDRSPDCALFLSLLRFSSALLRFSSAPLRFFTHCVPLLRFSVPSMLLSGPLFSTQLHYPPSPPLLVRLRPRSRPSRPVAARVSALRDPSSGPFSDRPGNDIGSGRGRAGRRRGGRGRQRRPEMTSGLSGPG